MKRLTGYLYFWVLLAIVAGTLVAGLSYAVLKRPEAEAVAAKAA